MMVEGIIGERTFPVLWPRLGGPRESIPWAVIEPHRAQATANHYQTLERLAERGGLSWVEMAAVLQNRKWAPMEPAAAKAVVLQIVAARIVGFLPSGSLAFDIELSRDPNDRGKPGVVMTCLECGQSEDAEDRLALLMDLYRRDCARWLSGLSSAEIEQRMIDAMCPAALDPSP